MRRRDFIQGITTSAVWPITARAQQQVQTKRIGVLMNFRESDPEGQARLTAFVQALTELGWIDGRNARLDIRWAAGDGELFRRYARELVALTPDVILAGSSYATEALQQATRTVPIVFAGVIDPIGAGIVESLAQPGGNITGFIAFEYSIAAKWLELLKEIAPRVTRAAVLRDAAIAAGIGQFAAIQAVGPIEMELSVVGMHDADAIEKAVAAFARRSNGGLVVTGSQFGLNYPDVIIALAARYKLPAVYPTRQFIPLGGLVSYGPDIVGQFRPAAAYVDRILKGEKPADLPVQAPTKYELVINMKTAKAIGLNVPPALLARADELIE